MDNDTKQQDLERINARLKELVLRHTPNVGRQDTAINNLYLSRRVEQEACAHSFYQPHIGVLVQGSKRSRIGNEECRYGEMDYLVIGVDVPGLTHQMTASEDKPFLAISLSLDMHLLARLAADIPATAPEKRAQQKGFTVSGADKGLLDAFLRLVELLESPETIPMLAPMIVWEIHSRLLMGACSGFLRSLSTAGTQSNHVARAIAWLSENFMTPMHIDTLAEMVNMAPSTFHRHFRQVTTISPLQFQKQLRLYEAQRLMLVENSDANSAALQVGYESVSQFNREYKRFFGDPPLRNIKRLAQNTVATM